MSESALPTPWYNQYLNNMIATIRKDARNIIIGAMVLAIIGAAIGKLTATSTSTAQLVMTPMPLNARSLNASVKTTMGDALAEMLAPPVDVTAISLLCKNDEVLQTTMDKLNALYEKGQLSAPIKNIYVLRNMLNFEMTIAKETPYDVEYNPLLLLSAEASNYKDAPIIVNTWADVVLEASKKLQEATQLPAATVLNDRVEDLNQELMGAEAASEKFWTENNVEYVQQRLNQTVGLIVSYMKDKTEIKTELIGQTATLKSYEDALANEKSTISLNWRPSPELVSALAGKMGSVISKKDTPAPSKEGEANKNNNEAAGGDKETNVPEGIDALSVENLNSVYWELRGKVAATQAGVSMREAQLREIDSLLEQLEKDRLDYQAQLAKLMTEKQRIGRVLQRVEDAYSNIAVKREFARVASKLNHPVLQLIAHGTEWPLPRFRRALAFGFVSGVLGLFIAASISLMTRLIIQPVLRSR